MKLVLVCGLSAMLACNRKGAADNLSTRRPSTFDAWMPTGAAAAWQGAWISRLTLSLTAGDAQPGDPIALEIRGGSATASRRPARGRTGMAMTC